MASFVKPISSSSLPPDESRHPLQFQRWTVIQRLSECNTTTYVPFNDGIAKLVADYAATCPVFGPQDWLVYFGVEVGIVGNGQLPEEALQWWNSLDAITPFDTHGDPIFNYETHYGFFYIPAQFRTLRNTEPLDLETFDLVAQKPKKGNPSRFAFDVEGIRQNKQIHAVSACWAAMRKEVLFRDKTLEAQRALMDKLNTETEAQMQALRVQFGTRYGTLTGTRYENFPDLLDLCVVVRTHYVKTGERLLGDNTGAEGERRYSVTQQQVVEAGNVYQVEVGGHSPSVFRSPSHRSSGGLLVSRMYSVLSSGVAGLRKFLVKLTPLNS